MKTYTQIDLKNNAEKYKDYVISAHVVEKKTIHIRARIALVDNYFNRSLHLAHIEEEIIEKGQAYIIVDREFFENINKTYPDIYEAILMHELAIMNTGFVKYRNLHGPDYQFSLEDEYLIDEEVLKECGIDSTMKMFDFLLLVYNLLPEYKGKDDDVTKIKLRKKHLYEGFANEIIKKNNLKGMFITIEDEK